MANLAEQLTALLEQAGIDNNIIVDMQKKLATSEISDDDVAKINAIKGNLTLEAAKAHPELNKYFKATILNGLDTEISNTINELGIDEDTKRVILAETNSFKRASLLTKTVKELEAKKVGASTGDKAKLAEQIESLNAQIASEKANAQKAVESVKGEYDNKFKSMYINNLLGSKNLVDYAKDENYLLANTKLMNEAKSKGYNIILDNDNLRLVNADGNDIFENNKKVDFSNFLDSTLANNKLIVTSTPPTPPTPQPQRPIQGGTIVQTGSLANVSNEAMKAFE